MVTPDYVHSCSRLKVSSVATGNPGRTVPHEQPVFLTWNWHIAFHSNRPPHSVLSEPHLRSFLACLLRPRVCSLFRGDESSAYFIQVELGFLSPKLSGDVNSDAEGKDVRVLGRLAGLPKQEC